MLDDQRQALLDVFYAEMSKKKWKLMREEYLAIAFAFLAREAVDRKMSPSATSAYARDWVADEYRDRKKAEQNARPAQPHPKDLSPLPARARRPRKG